MRDTEYAFTAIQVYQEQLAFASFYGDQSAADLNPETWQWRIVGTLKDDNFDPEEFDSWPPSEDLIADWAEFDEVEITGMAPSEFEAKEQAKAMEAWVQEQAEIFVKAKRERRLHPNSSGRQVQLL